MHSARPALTSVRFRANSLFFLVLQPASLELSSDLCFRLSRLRLRIARDLCGDEINLPSCGPCQTVAVITFLRQIAEHGGSWRASDLAFIKLDRIQFIRLLSTETEEAARQCSQRSRSPAAE